MLNRKHFNTLSLLLTAAMMISMTACSNRDEKNTDASYSKVHVTKTGDMDLSKQSSFRLT